LLLYESTVELECLGFFEVFFYKKFCKKKATASSGFLLQAKRQPG